MVFLQCYTSNYMVVEGILFDRIAAASVPSHLGTGMTFAKLFRSKLSAAEQSLNR